MRAVKTLPDNYFLLSTLDLSKAYTIFRLNILAIPLLFMFGWFFNKLIEFVRQPEMFSHGFLNFLTSFSGWKLVALSLSIILMLVLHELIHGIFFWLVTLDLPRFALKSGYAFTAAPGWYLPRIQYTWVGLSPLIIISGLSVLFAWIAPLYMIPYLFLIASFNAAGSLGDLIVAWWVFKQTKEVLINDEGDIFKSFIPAVK